MRQPHFQIFKSSNFQIKVSRNNLAYPHPSCASRIFKFSNCHILKLNPVNPIFKSPNHQIIKLNPPPCNPNSPFRIYTPKLSLMKKWILLIVLHVTVADVLWAQVPEAAALLVPKKRMLGVYNTSSVHIMPRVKQNTYAYYDMIGYPAMNYETRMAYSFRNTTGYRFFDALNLGAGFGVDNFESVALNLPFYGEISGNILNRRFTPVYFVQAGYGLGINLTKKDSPSRLNKAEGGLMAAAGIGFGVRLDKLTLLRLNFGYRLQQAAYTQEVAPYYGAPYTEIRRMTYQRIEIGLGFTFHQR